MNPKAHQRPETPEARQTAIQQALAKKGFSVSKKPAGIRVIAPVAKAAAAVAVAASLTGCFSEMDKKMACSIHPAASCTDTNTKAHRELRKQVEADRKAWEQMNAQRNATKQPAQVSK